MVLSPRSNCQQDGSLEGRTVLGWSPLTDGHCSPCGHTIPSAYAYIRIFPYEDTGVIGATKSDVLLPFRGAVSMQPYSGVMGIEFCHTELGRTQFSPITRGLVGSAPYEHCFS